jgi:hypothetical protein
LGTSKALIILSKAKELWLEQEAFRLFAEGHTGDGIWPGAFLLIAVGLASLYVVLSILNRLGVLRREQTKELYLGFTYAQDDAQTGRGYILHLRHDSADFVVEEQLDQDLAVLIELPKIPKFAGDPPAPHAIIQRCDRRGGDSGYWYLGTMRFIGMSSEQRSAYQDYCKAVYARP